jgi:2-C-methyl-D-erythritol 4-phosphate cytidylyltransferase
VAGGIGSRMKNTVPKQFIEIDGEPVVIKTLRCFLRYNFRIRTIISVHKDYKIYLQDLIKKSEFADADIQVTIGGETRFESVKNGLMLLNHDNAVVAIHDAARPFVALETIKSCFETAASKGNAIPCIHVNESLRKITDGLNETINRDEIRIIQTPQCFLIPEIKKAFEQDYNPMFTDDASVLESIGKKINLVEGNLENIKITSPLDLLIAQSLCGK